MVDQVVETFGRAVSAGAGGQRELVVGRVELVEGNHKNIGSCNCMNWHKLDKVLSI